MGKEFIPLTESIIIRGIYIATIGNILKKIFLTLNQIISKNEYPININAKYNIFALNTTGKVNNND